MVDQQQRQPVTEPAATTTPPTVAQPTTQSEAQPEAQISIEADDQLEREDTASVTGQSDISSDESQASLRSSILDYRRENGRTYHRLSDGAYVLPNDELEQERLDIVNHLWMLTLDGKFCLCPKNEGAKRVLDVGTGTGIWAMDYADEHPSAEVIGVDLSPIQPSYVPANCVFEVDDLEKEWTWTTPFDFVFARNLMGSFSDWEGFIKQAYDNLEPGGYLELQDSIYPIVCDDGTLKEDSALMKWTRLIVEAGDKIGRSTTIPDRFPRLLEEAGFEDINTTRVKFPVSPWPKDPKLKELGSWTQASLITGIEGISLGLFTRILNWEPEETMVFCTQVRDEVKDIRLHGYWNGIAVYARKPFPKEEDA
ncbi:hypothetical protein EsH8_V_000162 [Colletotrichum jinshuiense]